MTVSFYTLGCKLNQCESEALASAFRGQGFFIVSLEERPDIVVINTCTVTSKSEQKARRIIRKAVRDNPCSLIIVTGCYAQVEPDSLRGLNSEIIVVPQEEKHLLLEAVKHYPGTFPDNPSDFFRSLLRASAKERVSDQFSYEMSDLQFHTRPFLKIQDGCSRRCAYCRIPQARGPSRSLEVSNVMQRVTTLERSGYREVVITGVNITDYRCGEIDLSALLEKIVRATSVIRIRLSSLEPDQISSELFDIIASRRICPHFHIPVQSGSDAILSLMRRPYNSDMIYKVIDRLRRVKNDPFLAADVLVGFPGEGEEEFLKTKKTIKENDFSQLHVFPFSPRPNTSAVTLQGHVPESVVKVRAADLNEESKQRLKNYYSRWIGQEVDVLLERVIDEEGPPFDHNETRKWQGVSENYLKILVEGVPNKAVGRGSIVRVRLKPDFHGTVKEQ